MSGAWTVPASRLDVLVVEDEPRLRDLLTEVIPEMGLGVRAARSGEEALRIVKQQPPAMAVLDLHLPGMGGIELLEKLRAEGWGGPVIILTAYGTLAAARKAIGLEVSDFLEKPCRLRELELALDRARRRIHVVPDVAADQAQQQAAQETGDAAQVSAGGEEADAQQRPVTLAEAERQHILAVLKRHGGNRTRAAAELGISRRTLHYKLAQYRGEGQSEK